MDKNRSLTGTSGYCWFNGQLLTTLKNIELKVSGNFEEQNFCGDTGTYNVFTGWNGEGTITTSKVDSTVLKLVANAYKTGNMPDIKIITKLTDTATGKSERASVSGVVITEFMLAKFENKGLIEEEVPIKFSDYDILETL